MILYRQYWRYDMIKNIGVFKDFSDDSLKTVLDAGNHQIMEMTLLANNAEIDVVLAPTHYFCNLGCTMCHLTNSNIHKGMSPISASDFYEGLVQAVTKQTKETLERRTHKKKLLISFMGVGEPLCNLPLIEELYEREGSLKKLLGYEDVGYALSTIMPNRHMVELTKLVEDLQIPLKIYFSMHSSIDSHRLHLTPKAKLSLNDVLTYLLQYREVLQANDAIMSEYIKFHQTDDPIEILYTLVEGVNDSTRELEALCGLLENFPIPIRFMDFQDFQTFHQSPKKQEWIHTITTNLPAIRVKTYSIPGKEVSHFAPTCTKHYYHEELENEEEKRTFEEWKLKHQIFEQQRTDYLNWDEYFMAVAKLSAMRSKDPNTQVGACIVGSDNRILSIGYNGCPNGYPDENFPWQRNGEPLGTKYLYVVHAERNAILNYRGNRHDFEHGRIYVDLFPCNECAKEIIQSGITEVIYLSDKYADSNETIASKRLFDACGVSYRQLGKEHQKTLTIHLDIS